MTERNMLLLPKAELITLICSVCQIAHKYSYFILFCIEIPLQSEVTMDGTAKFTYVCLVLNSTEFKFVAPFGEKRIF